MSAKYSYVPRRPHDFFWDDIGYWWDEMVAVDFGPAKVLYSLEWTGTKLIAQAPSGLRAIAPPSLVNDAFALWVGRQVTL